MTVSITANATSTELRSAMHQIIEWGWESVAIAHASNPKCPLALVSPSGWLAVILDLEPQGVILTEF
jgi:hypothetical protein